MIYGHEFDAKTTNFETSNIHLVTPVAFEKSHSILVGYPADHGFYQIKLPHFLTLVSNHFSAKTVASQQ
jgi:hypothetical protein